MKYPVNTCYACLKKTDTPLFCHLCKLFQKTKALYFDIFPPKSFDLNTKDLKEKFFSIQKKIHPDTFKGDLKKEAQVASSFINEAYDTLKDPVKRGFYLINSKKEKKISKTFLNKIFQMKMSVQMNSLEENKELKRKTEKEIDEKIFLLKNLFLKKKSEKEIEENLYEVKYLKKLLDLCKSKIEEAEIKQTVSDIFQDIKKDV